MRASVATAIAIATAVVIPATAAAWSVTIDAPQRAGAGLPFLVGICAQAEGAGQIRAIASNATLDVRQDRYLAPFNGSACRDITVTPRGGPVELEARVRTAAGGMAKASASARVAIDDPGFVASANATLGDLRAPLVDGLALLPAWNASAAHLRIVEARAPPLAGVALANDGPGDAVLAAYRLNGKPFSNATLAANATLFLPMPVKEGALVLTAAARNESWLAVPKLKPGTGTLGRYGLTHMPSEAEPVNGTLVAYATPDASASPVAKLISSARAEVLVEAYTLTSTDIASALAGAADRGANVTVLLEGAPVGGVPADERALVATLEARGARVLKLGGEGARYRTVHAKVVEVDGRAAGIATENFNDPRTRGYGLIVENATLAARIRAYLVDDINGFDVSPFEPLSDPSDAAPLGRDAASLRLTGTWNVTLVLSPDDPLAIARLMRSARESVDVEMLSADAQGPMIDALLGAAQQGARVRVLLDGHVSNATNAQAIARIEALGARANVTIDARLDRADRTLHAKAIVVDHRFIYIGSMNWVRAAIEENREAGLIVESPELSIWLEKEMEKDRTGPTPKGLVDRREVSAPSGTFGVLILLIVTATTSRRACTSGRGGARTRSARHPREASGAPSRRS